jgi:hypothetical protein
MTPSLEAPSATQIGGARRVRAQTGSALDAAYPSGSDAPGVLRATIATFPRLPSCEANTCRFTAGARMRL